jgi:hypothetical protein
MAGTLREWRATPRAIESAISGLSEADLDLRGGFEGRTIREYVHHLVEANLVACSMIVAALGRSGCTCDSTWLWPNCEWMDRLGYASAPVGPALAALQGLCEHVAGVISRAGDVSRRRVRVRDAPRKPLSWRTDEAIVRQETEHVAHHLRELAAIRREHRR